MALAKMPRAPERELPPIEVSPRGDDVKLIVAYHAGITVRQMTGPSRVRLYAHTRQIAIDILRSRTSLSLVKIGKMFGNRDHSTVIHAARNVARLEQTDPAFAKRVSHLRFVVSDLLRHGNGQRLPPGELVRRMRAAEAVSEFLFAFGHRDPMERKACAVIGRVLERLGERKAWRRIFPTDAYLRALRREVHWSPPARADRRQPETARL